jgi:hypothetical protein
MKLRYVAALVWAVWLPVAANATPLVINNGLAPPNPANVIDASNSFPNDSLYIRNVGCDGTTEAKCPSPGDPTTVELVTGGSVGTPGSGGPSGSGQVSVFETSIFTMSDGFIRFGIEAWDSSEIIISGGTIVTDVRAFNSATIVITGGSMDGVQAGDVGSMVEIHGGQSPMLSSQTAEQ